MTVTVTNPPISLHEVLAYCHPGGPRRTSPTHSGRSTEP
jgi:hypothetical protein